MGTSRRAWTAQATELSPAACEYVATGGTASFKGVFEAKYVADQRRVPLARANKMLSFSVGDSPEEDN